MEEEDPDAVIAAALRLPVARRRELLVRLLSADPLEALGIGVTAFRARAAAAVEGLEAAAGPVEGPRSSSMRADLGGGSQYHLVPVGGIGDAFGCPWCRRPLQLVREQGVAAEDDGGQATRVCGGGGGPAQASMASQARQAPAPALPALRVEAGRLGGEDAVCTLLYGDNPRYFFGACVLGASLRRHDLQANRVLAHTGDVPRAWLEFLEGSCGWTLQRVEYLKGHYQVARRLFHGDVWTNRFKDVFTKLQAFALPYRKVALMDLDMLVRQPIAEALLSLEVPAAMVRGEPPPEHGERVPYGRLWDRYDLRRWDEGWEETLPRHQQSSGVNAGIMVLPGQSRHLLDSMAAELADWEHPEHYATYMPEQEYLSRWCGTFFGPRAWSHVDCRFNFELDKDKRVPFDFTSRHRQFKEDLSYGLAHLSVAHFSGMRIKPWELLFAEGGDVAPPPVATGASPVEGAGVGETGADEAGGGSRGWAWRPRDRYAGPPALGLEEDQALEPYPDALTKACLREWLACFRETFAGADVPALLSARECSGWS